MDGSTLVGKSDAHGAVLAKLERISKTNAEILITGPTGVGKELYARYAHAKSRRSSGPFVAVNCSNLSNELLENELFGHARGAYTSALSAGYGLVAAAERGTLLLDEVDALPTSCQSKLLRFIQTKQYRRLGETRLRSADVRFIAASNANLMGLVRDGRFREDLFFRLRVAPVEVSPLASRPDDIPALLEHFAALYAQEYEARPVRFSRDALLALRRYHWPGNVRELENVVRYLTCLQRVAPVRVEELPLCEQEDTFLPEADSAILDQPLKEAKRQLVNAFEKQYLERALRKSAGNVARAARAAGKHRRAFFELMRKHGIAADGYRGTTA